jgi:hypothetical protein
LSFGERRPHALDRLSALRLGRGVEYRVAFGEVALEAAHGGAEQRAVLAQRDRCEILVRGDDRGEVAQLGVVLGELLA